MIKLLKPFFISCMLIFAFVNNGLSQDISDSTLIVVFTDPNIGYTEANDFFNQYNMEVIDGPTPITRAWLAKVSASQGFPAWAHDHPSGPINGVKEEVDNESEVGGSGLNHGLINYNATPSLAAQNPIACASSQMSLTIPQAGSHPVDVEFFDTGLAPDQSFAPYLPSADPFTWGTNYIDPNAAPLDDNNHGTFMTSITVNHLNPYANLLTGDVNIGVQKTHNWAGRGYAMDIIQALDQAILAGTNIINMSFSYTHTHNHRNEDTPIRMAFDNARSAGILIVCAAGNNNKNNNNSDESEYPASFKHLNIIAVGAVDCQGQKMGFSNYGNGVVDIAAPGDDVPGLNRAGQLYSIDGTSPAAALVTSVAIQIARHKSNFNYRHIRCALKRGADIIPTLKPYFNGGRVLNAEGALNAYLSGNPCTYVPPSGGHGGGTGGGGHRVINSVDFGNNQIAMEIEAEIDQIGKVFISDITGKLLLQQKLEIYKGQNRVNLDFSVNKAQNLYIVTLQLEEGIFTHKIIR